MNIVCVLRVVFLAQKTTDRKAPVVFLSILSPCVTWWAVLGASSCRMPRTCNKWKRLEIAKLGKKTECKNVRGNDGRPPAPLFTGAGWLSFGRARAPALYSKWEWCPPAADELQFNIPSSSVFLGKVPCSDFLYLALLYFLWEGDWSSIHRPSHSWRDSLERHKEFDTHTLCSTFIFGNQSSTMWTSFLTIPKILASTTLFNAPTDHLGMAKDGKSQLWVNASTSSYNHPCFGWFRVENASIFPKWLLWLSWELVSSW